MRIDPVRKSYENARNGTERHGIRTKTLRTIFVRTKTFDFQYFNTLKMAFRTKVQKFSGFGQGGVFFLLLSSPGTDGTKAG